MTLHARSLHRSHSVFRVTSQVAPSPHPSVGRARVRRCWSEHNGVFGYIGAGAGLRCCAVHVVEATELLAPGCVQLRAAPDHDRRRRALHRRATRPSATVPLRSLRGGCDRATRPGPDDCAGVAAPSGQDQGAGTALIRDRRSTIDGYLGFVDDRGIRPIPITPGKGRS